MKQAMEKRRSRDSVRGAAGSCVRQPRSHRREAIDFDGQVGYNYTINSYFYPADGGTV